MYVEDTRLPDEGNFPVFPVFARTVFINSDGTESICRARASNAVDFAIMNKKIL